MFSALILPILTGCNASSVNIVENESYFSDFSVKGKKVYVKCEITMNNTYDADKVLQLYATLNDDVKSGLLRSPKLLGYNSNLTSSKFTIGKGKHAMTVIFVGSYGGTFKKHNRLLPPIYVKILS